MNFDNLGVRHSVSLCRSYTDCTNNIAQFRQSLIVLFVCPAMRDVPYAFRNTQSALPTVHIKRKAPAFPIQTKQKIMSFFSLITPQFQYIDVYLWRKTRLKVSFLHECPVLCIRIFPQGDAVGLMLCCPFRALWLAESHT